jgi:hypothetical protein
MRKDDGSPDIPAVLRFMEEDVSSYISKYELSPSEIQEACEKAYSKHPGGLDFKGMCTRALQEIVHVPDGAEGKIMNRIADHLRIESNKFKSGKDGKWLVSPGHAARVQMVTMDFADQYWEKQEAKAAKNIDG